VRLINVSGQNLCSIVEKAGHLAKIVDQSHSNHLDMEKEEIEILKQTISQITHGPSQGGQPSGFTPREFRLRKPEDYPHDTKPASDQLVKHEWKESSEHFQQTLRQPIDKGWFLNRDLLREWNDLRNELNPIILFRTSVFWYSE